MIDMGFALLKKQAHSLFDQAGFLCRIENESEYETALTLMEELIEDYDYNRPLIDILSRSIERWEDKAKAFMQFNKQIRSKNMGVAVLKTLMDQHDLRVADFPEIGSKSLMSRILSGQRRLTIDHIQALCKRFNIHPALFF